MSKHHPTPEETRESWNGLIKAVGSLFLLLDFVILFGSFCRGDWELFSEVLIFDLITGGIIVGVTVIRHLYQQNTELHFENRELEAMNNRMAGSQEWMLRATASEAEARFRALLHEQSVTYIEQAAQGQAQAAMYKESASAKLYESEYFKIAPELKQARLTIQRLEQQLNHKNAILAQMSATGENGLEVRKKSVESAEKVREKSVESPEKVWEKSEESPFRVLKGEKQPDLPYYIQNKDPQFLIEFIDTRIAVKRSVDEVYTGHIEQHRLIKGQGIPVGGVYVVWCAHLDCNSLTISRYQQAKYCCEEHRLDQKQIDYYQAKS